MSRFDTGKCAVCSGVLRANGLCGDCEQSRLWNLGRVGRINRDTEQAWLDLDCNANEYMMKHAPDGRVFGDLAHNAS